MAKDYTIVSPEKDELTSKGFTNKIKVKENITAEKLLEYGFTNNSPSTLYFMKMVGKGVSFNLSINKKSLNIERIDVLDENFLQPYDYQGILMRSSENVFARGVFNNVDKILKKLQHDGIIVGYERGMYV